MISDDEEEEVSTEEGNGDLLGWNKVYDYDRIVQLRREYSLPRETLGLELPGNMNNNLRLAKCMHIPTIHFDNIGDIGVSNSKINMISNHGSLTFHIIKNFSQLSVKLECARDLGTLKLEECKLYLRKHGLRLTGNKVICIQRIQEHWRIRDGIGEKLYPRSSFSINCTGDVCKGDVVLFVQKVYGRFDKMTRGGNLQGKRTIAGRVVKESYGTAKQQHTFTVEVLWSKGVKKLPPLSPSLVKGRNLYRLKTFRQRWDNESERSKVLAEKHDRGAKARELRARKLACSMNKGSKRKRHSNHTGRSPKRRKNQEPEYTARSHRDNHGGGGGKAPLVKQQNRKRSPEHLKPFQTKGDTFPMHHMSSMDNHQLQYPPRGSISHYDIGSASTMPVLRPEHIHNGFGRYPYGNSGYHLDPRERNYHQNRAAFDRHVPMGHYGGYTNDYIRCSTPGCGGVQMENCVVLSCWRCCRRIGRRCLGHQN
ncbi:hypothetical protein ACHQM5_024243 [Ranunculus cassubicifolius]